MAGDDLGAGACRNRNPHNLNPDMDPASIIALVTAGTEVIKLAMKARERARANGELTEAQDREFDAKIEEAFKQDHWRP